MREERFAAAIALDVGLAGDIPAVEEREYGTKLGAGPIVVHRDTGIIYDRAAHPALLRARPGHHLPIQDGLFAGYGSDGLALAEAGSPTSLVTVATRYTHTAFETIHPRRPRPRPSICCARSSRPRTARTPVSGEADKRAAAVYAAGLVEDGMRVGLGTGTTVAPLLPALAARGLALRCVSTSPATEAAALALGLAVEPFDEFTVLDIAIDGADQIGPGPWLVKGGGRAHTREKIVAAAAARFVVIASGEKVVERIVRRCRSSCSPTARRRRCAASSTPCSGPARSAPTAA